MSITIKSVRGKVLYVAETAQDVRAAVQEAIKSGSDLRWSDLSGSNLGGSDLRGSDLGGSDESPDDPGRVLYPFKMDVWAVLDAAPGEVEGLREKVAAGRINGSVYVGPCACLVGTIAKVREVPYTEIPGLTPDSGRPAEQWFLEINEGDIPRAVDAHPADGESEGAWRASWALEWIDEWRGSRLAIAKALAA